MAFDWDPNKEAGNIAKHGISFTEAQQVFSDDYLELEDERVYGEERLRVIGRIRSEVVLVVVVTYRGPVTRIISARYAVRSEIDLFFDHLFGLL